MSVLVWCFIVGSPMLLTGFHGQYCIQYIACVSRQLFINNHEMELRKSKIIVLLKHYWKQDYKATAAARRICEVEGEGIVSEHVTQRWFQRFNTREDNTKD